MSMLMLTLELSFYILLFVCFLEGDWATVFVDYVITLIEPHRFNLIIIKAK